MRRLSGRTVLTITLIGLVVGFAVLREFDLAATLAPIPGAALLLWAMLEWRHMALVARITLGVALTMAAVLAFSGELDSETLYRAIGRSAFFTFFLVAMDILRTAAMSSPMVLETGRVIVNQPPGRRYAVLTLGGHIFAVLLNLGSITLLGTMNRRSVDASDAEPDVRDIRLKRMTLALLRGFTAFTMWAPTSVTIFVVLSSIPDLEWTQIAPYGLWASATYITFGWLLDRLSYPVRLAAGPVQPLWQVLRRLLPMTMLTVAILTFAFLFSSLAGTRLVAALLMCVPISGLVWIFVQYLRAGPWRAFLLTRRRALFDILPGMTTLRSEIGILASSGFIGVLLTSQIDTDALGHFILNLGLTEGWLLVLFMWIVTLGAPVGLNPIISVSIGVEILSRLSGFDFNLYALAFSGCVAWALATGMSPLGATIRISGRAIDHPPYRIGLIWNGPFTACILVGGSILLLLLS